MQKQKLTNLLLFIIGTELVGALSGIISGGNFRTFYNALQQPPLAPPGWVFPAAWGILYALMGISAYLIYQTKHPKRKMALIIYGMQLFVNFLWSPIFFRLHSLTGATIVIFLLLAAVVVMLLYFRQIQKHAAWFNLPYLLWTMYAAYLTVGILVLNPNNTA